MGAPGHRSPGVADDRPRRRPRRLPLSHGPAAPAEPRRGGPRPRGGLVPRGRSGARRVPGPRVARGRSPRPARSRRHAPGRALGGADRGPSSRRARGHGRRPRRRLVARAGPRDHAGRPERAVRRDGDRPGAGSQGGGAGEPSGRPRLAGPAGWRRCSGGPARCSSCGSALRPARRAPGHAFARRRAAGRASWPPGSSPRSCPSRRWAPGASCRSARRALRLGAGGLPPAPAGRIHRRHAGRARRDDRGGRPHPGREPRFPGAAPDARRPGCTSPATARCCTRRRAGSSGTRTSPCPRRASRRQPPSGSASGRSRSTAVYASDLLRARQSAAPLAAARGTDVVVAAAAPRDRRWGAGRVSRSPRSGRGSPSSATAGSPIPSRSRSPTARVWPTSGRASCRPSAALVERHAGGRIAVIAHGGTNRVILAEALGLPLANIFRLAQDYAGWSLIEYRAEQRRRARAEPAARRGPRRAAGRVDLVPRDARP